jgi:hypothetical protein
MLYIHIRSMKHQMYQSRANNLYVLAYQVSRYVDRIYKN